MPLNADIKAPRGFVVVPGGKDWLTIAKEKMYGPGQNIVKLVYKDDIWELQLFKGRPVSLANLRILQPWVDRLNEYA